jgi:hypothetical protein
VGAAALCLLSQGDHLAVLSQAIWAIAGLQSSKANASVVRATFQNQQKAYCNTALLQISNKRRQQHRLSEIAYSSRARPH